RSPPNEWRACQSGFRARRASGASGRDGYGSPEVESSVFPRRCTASPQLWTSPRMRGTEVTTDPATMWAQACETVRARVGDRNFAAWIAPLRCTWLEGEIALEAPDRLTRELVGRHFAGVIADAVAAVAGRRCSLRLDLPAPPPPLPIRATPPLPDHTFDTFVVGESNARAFGAARALARQETAAPLFLHGPAGVGKTHLLHAIAHGLEARRLAVACLPAARLIEGLVAAIGEDRRLEGALRSLLAHAHLRGREIDAALALEILPALQRIPAAPPALHRIVEATARAFGVAARSLRGSSRRRELVLPRHVAMYLARKLCQRSAAELAREFGRNHTTVLNGWRSVAAKLGADRKLAALLAEIERRLVSHRL